MAASVRWCCFYKNLHKTNRTLRRARPLSALCCPLCFIPFYWSTVLDRANSFLTLMPFGGCGQRVRRRGSRAAATRRHSPAIAPLEREVMLLSHYTFCVARDGIGTDLRHTGPERHDRHRL